MDTAPSDLTARARLRHAALRLFAERGFDATSTRAIAVEAGVSHALLRHHYGSKQGLRQAVDEDVLDTFDELVRDLDESDDSPNQTGMTSAFGAATAQLFGADELRRGYLRRVLLDGGPAATALFDRLLAGARTHIDILRRESTPLGDEDLRWAPYQILFLILGPMLLEPVMRQALHGKVFDPDVLRSRSEANQRLLARGLLGHHPTRGTESG